MTIKKKDVENFVAAYEKYAHLSEAEAAAHMGISSDQVWRFKNKYAPRYDIEVPSGKMQFEDARPEKQTRLLTVQSLPSDDLPIEDIIDFQARRFEQKRKYEEMSKQIKIDIHVKGPLGIWWFGDPHVDDSGTDIRALFDHAKMTRDHDYVFGGNIGDTTNNWVGGLARLYANQDTSKATGLKIQKKFLNAVKWLFVIDGNHDAWSGADSPIKPILEDMSVLHMSAACRVKLELPEGEPVTINSRHNFPGNSMYNTAHGATKELKMGIRDHIAINGHKHSSGYLPFKAPGTGEICHAVQIASYKIFDSYAKDLGFQDAHFSPGCMTVIDPFLPATSPDRIKVFWDADMGLRYLQCLRTHYGFKN